MSLRPLLAVVLAQDAPPFASTSTEGVLEPELTLYDAPRPIDTSLVASRGASTTFVELADTPEADMPRDVAMTPDGRPVVPSSATAG